MRMFFSRRRRRSNGPGRALQNQEPGRNQGVLYKIPGQGANQPNLGGGTLQVDNQGVLYKKTDPPLLIALMLLLTIAGRGVGMTLPVLLLIIGMSVTPFPAAIPNHFGVLGIDLALPPAVIVAPTGLTFRPTADCLIGTARRRSKGLLAIRAAARRGNHSLRGLFRVQP